LLFIVTNPVSMKTHILLTLLLIPFLLFVSCKDDDEGTPRQMTKTYTYSQNLRGSAGVKGELPLPDLRLVDVIGTEPASTLRDAELQLAESHLEISGLNQLAAADTGTVILEDFTIRIGNRSAINLGNCSTDPQGVNEFASDVQLSTNQMINIIQNVFADLTSGSKNAKISVSFTPSVDITTADNLQLNIHFGGIYHYAEIE